MCCIKYQNATVATVVTIIARASDDMLLLKYITGLTDVRAPVSTARVLSKTACIKRSIIINSICAHALCYGNMSSWCQGKHMHAQ